ncbi:MAG: nitroreductase family protein [Ilumatobacteraceae bacterium]
MSDSNEPRADLRDAIRSTGSVRSFTNRPVDDETVASILDDARFAPSGGNRQPWRVAVVRDESIRRDLGVAMRPVWDEYVRQSALGRTPFTVVEPAPDSLTSTAPGNVPNDLLDHITEIPVVLAVAADLSRIAMMDKDLDRSTLTGGASVYPFCWSILLAARARDLGGVMTTFASRVEPAVAPMLGLPANHALAATIFLGHPVKRTTKLTRNPVRAFTTRDRFDGPEFGA